MKKIVCMLILIVLLSLSSFGFSHDKDVPIVRSCIIREHIISHDNTTDGLKIIIQDKVLY